MWFDDWSGIGRTLLMGVLGYATLVIFVRVAGKRALSKLNAFDLVITVALGSTLAAVMTTQSVTFTTAVTTFGVLLGLQFLVAFTSARWPPARKLVKSEPTLVFFHGHFLDDSIKRQRLTRDELLSAVRSAEVADLDQVYAIVLETNGELSVIPFVHKEPTRPTIQDAH